MAVIAMDLGGTKLAGAIFNRNGRMQGKMVVPLQGGQGRAVGKLICGEVTRFLETAQGQGFEVSAIGVSVPGISSSRTGKVWAPNIPGWEDYPLKREIETAVRRYFRAAGGKSLKRCVYERRDKGGQKQEAIRVVLDSDRACYILGETWRGVAKGCRNAIFLAVGTGIGAGVLIDGKILRGAHDIAGAVGWLALDRPFRPEYVHCGCFEYHASGEGLAKVAREILKRKTTKCSNPTKTGLLESSRRGFDGITAQDVFAAYESGDAVAKEVLVQAVGFWGMAVANLVSLFNPEKIIFGGGVFGPARQFLGDIYAEAKKWGQPISMQEVKMTASKLGGDAGLYGAGCLALQAGGARG